MPKKTPKTPASGQRDCTLPPVQPLPASTEVEKLDSWFEGVSRPSHRIQELFERKRDKHDALLRQLRQALFRERSAAERTATTMAANLRTELDKASLMVELKAKELARAAKDIQDDGTAFGEDEKAANSVVQQLTEQCKRAVDAFYDLLLDVEGEHQKRAKDALAKCACALALNGHLPPHRLQPILDAERKEMSERHLRHVISFGDLRLCLTMHAEQDCRRFKESVENSRRAARERKQRAAVCALQMERNKSIEEHLLSTARGREILGQFEKQLEELMDNLCWKVSYPYHTDEVLSWERKIQILLQQADSSMEPICQCLNESLRHLKIFGIKQMEGLKDFLLDKKHVTNKKNGSLYQNVWRPLLASVDEKIKAYPTELMVQWKQMHKNLTSGIRHFTCLLKNAGELWEEHCQCRETNREQIIKDLNRRKQDRGKCTQAREKRIANLIDKCYQETDKKCVMDNIARIVKILEDVKCSYESMHRGEKELVEEYSSTFDQECDSLVSSLSLFLNKYRISSSGGGAISRKGIHSLKLFERLEETEKLLHLQQTRLCEEIDEFLREKCKSFVQQEGREWILQQVSELQNECDSLIKAHSLRIDEIHSNIEIVRLNEISEHKRLSESQKEEIKEVQKDIEEALKETCIKEFQIFDEFSTKVKLLKEEGLLTPIEELVRGTIGQIETTYAQCQEMVQKLNDEFQKLLQTKIQTMKNCNINFLRSLKCHSDGGTFVRTELINLKSEITSLELDTEACARQSILSLKQKSKDCCAEAVKHVKMCLRDLQLHIDAIIFTKDVSVLVQNTQERLRENVLGLKYGGQLLMDQTSELINHKSKNDYSPDINNKWRCLMETLEKRQEYLLGNVLNANSNELIGKSKHSELIKHSKDNSFLSTVMSVLETSLQKIQNRVVVFHQRKVNYAEVESLKVKNETQEFMKSTTQKYKVYQEQCIVVWINEIAALIEAVLSLRHNYKECWDKAVQSVHEKFSAHLENEILNLNIQLARLRKNYQEYQINTMAKWNPNNRFADKPHTFHSLCIDFEKISAELNVGIKENINSFMDQADVLLHDYEDDLQNRVMTFTATAERLFGLDLTEDLVQKIERALRHLDTFYSFSSSINKDLFCYMSSLQPNRNNESKQCTYCPGIIQAITSLLMTVTKLRACYRENTDLQKWQPDLLTATIEKRLQVARELVHKKSCEVRQLHKEYDQMATNLRTKWKNVSESV